MFKEAKEVTPDYTNKVVIVVTKEGYRFEVTIDDTTTVSNPYYVSSRYLIMLQNLKWIYWKVKVKNKI